MKKFTISTIDNNFLPLMGWQIESGVPVYPGLQLHIGLWFVT